MKYVILFLLSYISLQNIYTQNNQKIDSLLNIINTSKLDTIIINSYIELSELFRKNNTDTAIYFSNKGLILSEQKGYIKGQSHGLSSLGIAYTYKGDYEKALGYYEKALNLNIKMNYKEEIMQTFNSIGGVNYYLDNLPKAIENFQKSATIAEQLGDEYGFAQSYNNISSLYNKQKQYDKAIEYLDKSLQTRQKINDVKGIASCYNNLGGIYFEQKKYSEASQNFIKSLEIKEKLDDKKGMASCYNNLGSLCETQSESEQNQILKNQKQQESIDYYSKALSLYLELSDKNGLAAVYGNLSGLNLKLKNINKSIEFAQKAIDIAKEIGSLSWQKNNYERLAEAYYNSGNFKLAFDNFKIFKQLNDSIFNEDGNKQIAEMETKYQTEKKQLQIDKLEKQKELDKETIARKDAESQKQKILIYSFVLGFIVILVFAFILFKMFVQKKKANQLLTLKNIEVEQKNEEITAQRDEIEAQRNEVQKHRDLVVYQKEEIESSITYAQRIQNAVLPTVEHLNMFLSDYFIFFRPKDIVSGDFYWATIIKNWQIYSL